MRKSPQRRSAKSNRRRPFGISRRHKKSLQARKNQQLNFETLEDRRVMSAESPLPYGPFQDTLATVSHSSATAGGQEYILLAELDSYQSHSATDPSQIELYAIPTDEYLDLQWALGNFGQDVGNPDFQPIFGVPGEDINVFPVWNQGLTGAGVVVQINDSGVEFTHPDLDDNIDPSVQFDALAGDSNASPDLIEVFFDNAHGTAVAGIVGAEANGIGGVGVAPGVQLVPVRLIDTTILTPDPFNDAFRFRTDLVDITQNSWGPGVVRGVAGPSPSELLALRDSIIGPDAGRDGLGTIHVFSSGNSGEFLDTANYNGWVNSRYTIGVTGVDHDGEYNNVDGTVTGYPESGSSVLVAAPTGSVPLLVGLDTGVGSGIVTTDTTSDTGFNQDPLENGEQPNRDFLEDEAYTSRFNGTSAASPFVSGVVALMLEANPNLSWRDVQEILVRSSRQNAEFATQANGVDKATGIEFQNTWIVNQVPLFHDPDIHDDQIDDFLQLIHPTLDPNLNLAGLSAHYAPTPQVLTNGAGYTVSQGRGTNSDQVGYAHGVVDAELAVQLAQQWNLKGQSLPQELSFTTALNGSPNLPSAEVVLNVDGLSDLVVPGGLFGEPGFSDYWAEFLLPDDQDDFSQGFFQRGAPIELTVPSPNDMVVETLEITVDIDTGSGTAADVLDNVRMVLVSPTGTHTELNYYFVDGSFDLDGENHQVGLNTANGGLLNINGFDAVTDDADFGDPGSVDTQGGNLQFTFSTNRSWGERSDDALIFDPTTMEPVDDIFGVGGNRNNVIEPSAGTFLTQGWQIIMENYGTIDFVLDNFEMVWHGRPISPDTQRIQGLIGVDDNRDDLFNYSRVTEVRTEVDGDPTTLRLGEIQHLIDPDHESMAANITVLAYHDVDADGVIDPTDLLVDQFVTGADGNYYFDLVPDDYIIALDTDSLGTLTPLDDSLTPTGFLQDYQAQWEIGADYFNVWDYDANLEVPIDPLTNAPRSLVDATGNAVEYHVNHVNFLLDPGDPATPEVVFNGQVIADVNGDGIFNGTDTVAPGVLIFGDVNRNNQFDSGEAFTSTDANGNYSLVVPSTIIANINVGAIAPVDWDFTNPSSGILQFFTEPGDVISGVDFAIQPPADGGGVDGSALPGTVLGFVFDDDNEDGIRQASEAGIANIEVYIDNNDSGANDAGDTVVTTNASGAFIFSTVPVGTHKIRIDLSGNPTLEQTVPVFNLPNTVTITGENTISGVRFGLNNLANLDYGDLPEIYGTLFNAGIHNDLTGGARHTKGIFFLGSGVDAEINGVPSADALGDDVAGINDEDGIFVDPLVAGGLGQVEAIASVPGGYLQAWMDFNGDGDFDDVIGGVAERIFTNALLDSGSNALSFQIPDVIEADTVYARFRFGEFGLGLHGLGQIGEVEDYVVPKFVVVPVHGPDFNGDGDIDGGDFLALQRGFGIQTNALPGNGDANSDGAVGMEDFHMWQQGFTGGTAALAASQSGGSGDDSSTPPLAAVITSSVDDDEFSASVFEAYYGSGHSSVSTLGPRLVQPGFPEELPNTVVDTESASSQLTRNQLAAVTGRVGVRSAYATTGNASAANEQEAPPEFAVTSFDQAFEADEYAFSQRQVRLERLATRDFAETEEVEALALALDEDIDWLQL